MHLCRDILKNIDIDVQHKLEAPGAPPIIGLVTIESPEDALESLVEYLSGDPDKLQNAFQIYLYATCWNIATILRREYGTGENYGPNAIYPLLKDALHIPFSTNGSAQNALHNGFNLLRQKMGISQSIYNRHVDIYLAQAGVAENMLKHLAIAFLRQERHFGLPSESSSQELNQWEDDALIFLPQSVSTPRLAVELDETGWHAALYTKIRNKNGENSSEERFETAFREAIEAQDSKVSSRNAITIIPRLHLCWNDEGLGLDVPRLEGRLKFWPDPEPDSRLMLRGGEVWQLAEPWPMEMRWQSGEHRGSIPFLCNPDAIAVFDRQSGRFVCEILPQEKPKPLNIVEAILLCRQKFSVDDEASHMLSEEAHVASLTLEAQPKHIVTNGGSFDLALQPRRRITAIGNIIAKNAQKNLYGPEVEFRIETGQEIPEKRNLRISTTNRKATIPLDFDNTGVVFVTLPEIFSALAATDSSSLSNPLRLQMELPGPGERSMGGMLVAEFWVWPNVAVDNHGFLLKTPRPATNLSLENCQHIVLDRQNQICLNRDGGYAHAYLAFEIDKIIERFYLPYPGVTCVRHTANGRKHFLPRRSQVVLREEERFDTITIRCPDHDADLLVRGRRERTPFLKGSPRNIALRDLKQTSGDDRVLIYNGKGMETELFRVVEALEPNFFELRKLRGDELQLTLETSEKIDAFQLTLEDELGEVTHAKVALKHRPVDEPPVAWLAGEIPPDNSQQARLQINPRKLEGLHLAKILVRPEGQEVWKRLGNLRGDIYALLIDDGETSIPNFSDRKRFQTLSRWMAHCYAPKAWEQMGSRLYQRWQELGKRLFDTPEGRSTVLAAAMTSPPEDAASSWVPIAHPLTFLPELYSVAWQHFEALAACEDEGISALSIIAEVSADRLRDKNSIDRTALISFANPQEADNGEPLRDFDPKHFLENIQHEHIDDDLAAGWLWRGKPFLGPGHWRAAHIRFDERIETIGLFAEQGTNERAQNAGRKTSLHMLMSKCYRDAEMKPPVPTQGNTGKELNEMAATTLCAFAKEARVGCVSDWAANMSENLGCKSDDILQDIAFLLRLAPELFAFYMGMWQLMTCREQKFSTIGDVNYE